MAAWQEGDVQTNGINIHYYRTGGDKPPVVMAHGITDSGLCFTRVARALEADYDVIMVDARGHGQSDKPETGYGSTTHAADLAGLIEALGLTQPAVIGHSMGGATSTYLAADWPDRVRGVVLEDPPWRELHVARNLDADALEVYRQRILARGALPLEDLIAEGKRLNLKWADDDFPAWAAAKHQVVPQVTQIAGDGRTWAELIATFKCPTLVLIGEQGVTGSDVPVIVMPETAAAAQLLNPNIRVEQIAGAAHNIRRDQFEGYMAAVRPFLAGLYAA